MTGARLWRTVANYLRTPIGGACVVAAGVALALALLVLPAVDDGFRSQPAASQGTALPAPTGVAVTPVPTIAKRAAVKPSVAPAVLMFRLATANPAGHRAAGATRHGNASAQSDAGPAHRDRVAVTRQADPHQSARHEAQRG